MSSFFCSPHTNACVGVLPSGGCCTARQRCHRPQPRHLPCRGPQHGSLRRQAVCRLLRLLQCTDGPHLQRSRGAQPSGACGIGNSGAAADHQASLLLASTQHFANWLCSDAWRTDINACYWPFIALLMNCFTWCQFAFGGQVSGNIIYHLQDVNVKRMQSNSSPDSTSYTQKGFFISGTCC